MIETRKPIAIYYEHPDWFRPLFAELDRRQLPYVRIDPGMHRFDPKEKKIPNALVFNRMSPSAYLRDGVQGIFFTHAWLEYLQQLDIPTVNGLTAFSYETSKARQLMLLEKLGLDYPRSHVVNHDSQVVSAASTLRFPVMVKANVGGSGAGMVRFDSLDSLEQAVFQQQLDFGVDHIGLVQEFIPARNQQIIRVELLGGKFLYAIKILMEGNSFNLCPADICQRSDGIELVRTACPLDAPKSGMKVENYNPPADVIKACESIVEHAGVDVGGIEYMIDDRDGRVVFYDINALSNFVADAINVVGFDPFAKLTDYLEHRAYGTSPQPQPVS